jgi:hypothetical protein
MRGDVRTKLPRFSFRCYTKAGYGQSYLAQISRGDRPLLPALLPKVFAAVVDTLRAHPRLHDGQREALQRLLVRWTQAARLDAALFEQFNSRAAADTPGLLRVVRELTRIYERRQVLLQAWRCVEQALATQAFSPAVGMLLADAGAPLRGNNTW